MTVNWSIQQGAIIVAVEGEYTSEELERAVSSALYSPQFPAGGALLFDGRLATTTLTSEILDHRTRLIASLLDHGVISHCAAVIAPERRHQAADVRARLRESGAEIQLFASMDEGLKWLDSIAAAAADHQVPPH